MTSSVRTREQLTDRVSDIVGSAPPDIEEMRRWLGLTQEELADAVGRSRRTVARWNPAAPDHTVARGRTARTLRQLHRIQFLLDEIVGRDVALVWLRSPNRGFRGQAPLDLILEGRSNELIAALEALADGVPL